MKMAGGHEATNDELAQELATGLTELHTGHLDNCLSVQSMEESISIMLQQLEEFSALQVGKILIM